MYNHKHISFIYILVFIVLENSDNSNMIYQLFYTCYCSIPSYNQRIT